MRLAGVVLHSAVVPLRSSCLVRRSKYGEQGACMAHLDLSHERGAGCDLRDTQVSAEDFMLRTCLDQAEFGQKQWDGPLLT